MAVYGYRRVSTQTQAREVKQLKKAQGKFTGGKAAFGYEVVDWVKTPNPKEEAVIRKMIRMRKSGATYRKIAEWLNKTHYSQMTLMGMKHIPSVGNIS